MNQGPSISVIIPTRHRLESLHRCLEGLADSTWSPHRFEVIVVADGGECSLTEAIAPFESRLALKFVRQRHRGPAAARNLGCEHASAPLLAFTDDDCRPMPDWLEAISQAAESAPSAMIGGVTTNAVENNRYSEASQILIEYLYEFYLHASGQPQFFASNNFAIPAAPLAEIGGFDERFKQAGGEDRELCWRWAERGWRASLAADARVLHYHVLDARSFLRQHFNYGRGAYLFREACVDVNRTEPRIEPVSFYLRLIRYPGRRTRFRSAVSLSILLLLSQASNACGFAWQKLADRSVREIIQSGPCRTPGSGR